jgi:hypothetical protein
MIDSPALDWHRSAIALYQRTIARYLANGIADRDAGHRRPRSSVVATARDSEAAIDDRGGERESS